MEDARLSPCSDMWCTVPASTTREGWHCRLAQVWGGSGSRTMALARRPVKSPPPPPPPPRLDASNTHRPPDQIGCPRCRRAPWGREVFSAATISHDWEYHLICSAMKARPPGRNSKHTRVLHHLLRANKLAYHQSIEHNDSATRSEALA